MSTSANLARFPVGGGSVTATASSEYSGSYAASNTIDGSLTTASEWASLNCNVGGQPWLRVTWANAQNVSRVWVRGRVDRFSTSVRVTTSNGYSQDFSATVQGTGEATLNLTETQMSVTWVQVQSLTGCVDNGGLSEVEVYHVTELDPVVAAGFAQAVLIL